MAFWVLFIRHVDPQKLISSNYSILSRVACNIAFNLFDFYCASHR